MPRFNEENKTEQMVLDTLASIAGTVQETPDASQLYTGQIKGWTFITAEQLPRQHSDVFVEQHLRDALIRLNPELNSKPDRADEVLYRLRTIPLQLGVKPKNKR